MQDQINDRKYSRLLDHLADDGAADHETLVGVIKVKKPELIRAYLQKAIDEDDEAPDLIDSYNSSLNETVDEGPVGDPGPEGEPGPPGEADPDVSTPADAPTPEPATTPTEPVELQQVAPAAVNGDTVFQLLGDNGQVTELTLHTQKKNRVILKEKPQAQMVNMIVGGRMVAVDVNGVTADSTVNVDGRMVSGADILAAAKLSA